MGIYNPVGLYSISPNILPPQSIPLKEKLHRPKEGNQKTWGEKCMDALETIGRSQYSSNLKLIENYEMIKGRFVFNHYFQTEGYQSMLNQLTAEFELPTYLRHYDIIGQVINTMTGEWQKRPDTFKVRQVGDTAANEYLRTKLELTQKYVFDKINSEVNRKLLEQGVDLTKEDFESEEEAQAHQQQIAQAKQQLTPKGIQKYMDTDFLTLAEIWAQHQKEFDKEYFNLPEKEKVEFEDMLVADRAFRHFYVTSTGYNQETWNPVNVFFQKGPDTVYIEDGDYVGRIFSLSINTIVDRYGFMMTKEDFENLQGKFKKDKTQWDDKEYNWIYDNYLVPFQGYPAYDIMRQSWGKPHDTGVPELEGNMLNSITQEGGFSEKEGYYFVTEAYWKTQKKIIKITYIDQETQQIVVDLVDENYTIPKGFKESNRIFDDEHEAFTYCETFINEVWRGIKINAAHDKSIGKDIYIQIGPNEFQFKGDLNRYGCKLPVCGQIFSVRNSKSMSLVDMMKPYQIAYNVCQNQIYQLMEKEIGMFVVMDVNMFPNNKDWGGEDAWDKWMLVAKQYGILPADTSPQNIKNSLAATGGFLPKVLDLNLASQMISRVNLAKFFEEQALKQVGFNQYRTGSYAASATATGVEQGMAKSYSQTESYFTNFSNYLRRCLQMSLDISQYVQSKKEQIQITYTKSDHSRAFVKILGTDILLADLGVLISNNQEHVRQLEMMRQYAMSNNTSGMSPVDVADIIMMNNPNEILNQLKLSYSKLEQNQQKQQEYQQQALEQEKQIKEAELQQKQAQFQELMDNNLDVERIRAGMAIINSNEQLPEMPQDSSLSDSIKSSQNVASNNLKQQKIEVDKAKTTADIDYKQKKLALEQARIAADLQIQQQESQSVRLQNKNKML